MATKDLKFKNVNVTIPKIKVGRKGNDQHAKKQERPVPKAK